MFASEELSPLETAIEWIKLKLKIYKVPFTSSMIVGLLTYMFIFTNKLPNWDDVEGLFHKGGSTGSGRWMLDVFQFVFPNFSMPWIYGIISIVLISIAACVIIKTFNIRTVMLQAVIAGMFVAFPPLINTFPFMFTASSYAVAVLFAVLSVYFFTKNKISYKILALVLSVISVGTYQANICTIMCFFVLLSIQKLLEDDVNVSKVFITGISYIGFLLVSLALYYGILKIAFIVSNVSFNEYSTTASDTLSLTFPQKIKLAYATFIYEFIYGTKGLIPTVFLRAMNILCIILTGIKMLVWFKKKRQILQVALLAALVILLPLCIESLIFAVNFYYIRTLALWSFFSIYILFVIVAEKTEPLFRSIKIKHFTRDAIAVLMALIIIGNIYSGNEAYLRMNIKYEHVHSYYTTLTTRIQSLPEFSGETSLALIGDQNKSDLVYKYTEFDNIASLGDADFFNYIYSKEKFILYYIGFNIKFSSEEEKEAISQTDEFANMGVYPYENSIKRIGDTIVVKFS